jgi:membrane protein required for colicin V production
MTWADWCIVAVLAGSVLTGLLQGFFRTVCSLIGLFAGLTLAAWNYHHVAALLLPLVHVDAIADTIAFFAIALLVLALANLVGAILGKTLEWMGLGCLDVIAGGIVGFFQGALIVTLCIMLTLAFFPKAQWLSQSQLAHLFFGACNASTHLSPEQLADRVLKGIRTLELQSPPWLHGQKGVS